MAESQTTGIPTRPLGKTGVDVSILCLGGAHIGLIQDEAESIKLMHTAVDEGITFFDNAWDYHGGRSEELMGKALETGGRREKVFLMTKNCERDYKGTLSNLDDSLKRLGVDFVDVVQIHNPPSAETDTTVPGWLHLGLSDYLGPGGALEGLERVRRAGKTRFFGFANEDAGAEAVHTLLETREFHLINVWYDLLNPTAGMDRPDGLDIQHDYGRLVDRAHELGVGVSVIRPLAGGVLTDHAVAGGGRHALAGGGLTRNADMYQAMVQRALPFAFLSRPGQKLSDAAYRFILQHPGVTTVLGGYSELSHLEEASGNSGANPLSDEDMARLETVWRSNCGRWSTAEQFISGL